MYYASTMDLEVLVAAWNTSTNEILGQYLNGIAWACANFDRMPEGKCDMQISTQDLSILLANWNIPVGWEATPCQDILGSQE